MVYLYVLLLGSTDNVSYIVLRAYTYIDMYSIESSTHSSRDGSGVRFCWLTSFAILSDLLLLSFQD